MSEHSDDPFLSSVSDFGTPRTWTFVPKAPRPMTRRETYRHCIDNGWRWRDALLVALLSEDERPEHHERLGPTFTMERTDP